MDSCAVMRGSKSGFETRIREEVCPHLVDIDGDSCHHIHNCCKKFCKQFDHHVETLFTDLHTDSKWTSDVKTSLQKLCNILDVKYTAQDNYVPHRWLSVYDIAMCTLRLFNVYMLYYYAFLPNDEKQDYGELLEPMIMGSLTSENRSKIANINKSSETKIKSLTEAGKKRKNRIVEKLFFDLKKTSMILNLYTSVLPLLKTYTLIFSIVTSVDS